MASMTWEEGRLERLRRALSDTMPFSSSQPKSFTCCYCSPRVSQALKTVIIPLEKILCMFSLGSSTCPASSLCSSAASWSVNGQQPSISEPETPAAVVSCVSTRSSVSHSLHAMVWISSQAAADGVGQESTTPKCSLSGRALWEQLTPDGLCTIAADPDVAAGCAVCRL